MPPFLLGINYWPQRTAMAMWERFDLGALREDFARIAGLGLKAVRFFLSWEAFQPEPLCIEPAALRRLTALMDALAAAGLVGMPTLFTGHMSGVNWLPRWTLERDRPHGRFRTIAGGRTVREGIGDFYADPHLLHAQTVACERIGTCLRGHPALYAWDLGNEFSNLREPASPADGAAWSVRLSETLLAASGAGCTGGMHGEDLERDRRLRPSSMAQAWSFATMHGYPAYSAFARGTDDPNVVPYLLQLMQSCSGRPVLFSELGNPNCPLCADAAATPGCLFEETMAAYATAAIDRLHRRGALGALWWCWADYDPALAQVPPFDQAPHELRFGIVRTDGSFKPVAHALAALARDARPVLAPPPPIVDEDAYYAALPAGIARSYRDYCRLHA